MQTLSARWFGAGHSTATDSAKAGSEATAEALAGRTPAVVFVFAAAQHDLPALIGAVRAEAGDGPVIVGGTTMGELSAAGVTTHGVATAAFGGAGFTVRATAAQIGPDGHRAAGAQVAAGAAGLDRAHRALLLLFDGFSGDPDSVVRGAFSVVGAGIPLVGGLTADGQRFRQSAQFFGVGSAAEVLTNAVVGVAIGSDRPLSIGIAHGWRRTEPAMIATKSRESKIYEIDGRPALDVLAERLGLEATAEALFRDGKIHVLGLARRSGEDARMVSVADDEERSIFCGSEVPQGALFWLMEAENEALLEGARQSCAGALAGLGGETPLGVLAFDCGGRLQTLGESGTRQEVAAIRSVLGDTPFAGFYTMGEVARARGSLGMHGLTLVTLAMA